MIDQQGIEIPIQQVSEEALLAVIEDFITREGTDYGHQDFSLAQKVGQVRAQLDSGKIALVFDPVTQSCTLLVKNSH